jgi:hypothetical protein
VTAFELELYSESEKRPEQNRSAFQYVTALVLPSLAVLASIFALNNHSRITILLVVLACVSFAAGLYRPLNASLRRWRTRRAVEAIAKSAFPEMRKFVRRFEASLTAAKAIHCTTSCNRTRHQTRK